MVDKVKEGDRSSDSRDWWCSPIIRGLKQKSKKTPKSQTTRCLSTGSSIHGQQDPLPMALAPKGDCAFWADISARSMGHMQPQEKPRLWPHLYKTPKVSQLPAWALAVWRDLPIKVWGRRGDKCGCHRTPTWELVPRASVRYLLETPKTIWKVLERPEFQQCWRGRHSLGTEVCAPFLPIHIKQICNAAV